MELPSSGKTYSEWFSEGYTETITERRTHSWLYWWWLWHFTLKFSRQEREYDGVHFDDDVDDLLAVHWIPQEYSSHDRSVLIDEDTTRKWMRNKEDIVWVSNWIQRGFKSHEKQSIFLSWLPLNFLSFVCLGQTFRASSNNSTLFSFDVYIIRKPRQRLWSCQTQSRDLCVVILFCLISKE